MLDDRRRAARDLCPHVKRITPGDIRHAPETMTTALDAGTTPLPLVSEAVRGDGAVLVARHEAEMFHVKQPANRDAMLARWLQLTRELLPDMARAEGWPIHLDHCFMRVCLDAALGAPWTATVARPAVRHMSDDQLAAALAVAEGIAAEPARLPPLNAASIAGRRAAKARR